MMRLKLANSPKNQDHKVHIEGCLRSNVTHEDHDVNIDDDDDTDS